VRCRRRRRVGTGRPASRQRIQTELDDEERALCRRIPGILDKLTGPRPLEPLSQPRFSTAEVDRA